jgi:hypothetical protein
MTPKSKLFLRRLKNLQPSNQRFTVRRVNAPKVCSCACCIVWHTRIRNYKELNESLVNDKMGQIVELETFFNPDSN